MKKIALLLGILLTILSCNQPKSNKHKANEVNLNDRLLNALVWYNKSAEKRAIYYQTFNIAKKIVLKQLQKKHDKPLAVITDIDETVLDNSGFELSLLKNNVKYSDSLWSKWENDTKAVALPGAVEFSQFLKKNNVELFYISNRSIKALKSTIENLRKEGFAYADSAHLLLRKNTKDKTARRNIVNKSHTVILLLGDNLRDFDEKFKYETTISGWQKVDENKDLFGTKYLIMPNPLYGQWLHLVKGSSLEDFRKFLIENY